jgi:two-component system LytT family response regulator
MTTPAPRFRTVLIDDERLARRELTYLLQPYAEIDIVGEAGSVRQAVEVIATTHPNLLFLDIQMPRENGFELFDRTTVTAAVIFVTAHDSFAVRAFEVNALDYLMKPVNPRRLAQSIQRLVAETRAETAAHATLGYDDSIFLTIGNAPRFVKLSSIVCILAEGDYSRVVGPAGPMGLVLKSLRQWEALLPPRQFCRVQRSVIINCERVERFDPWFNGSYQVHLQHVAAPVTMSRRLARTFRARFGV